MIEKIEICWGFFFIMKFLNKVFDVLGLREAHQNIFLKKIYINILLDEIEL